MIHGFPSDLEYNPNILWLVKFYVISFLYVCPSSFPDSLVLLTFFWPCGSCCSLKLHKPAVPPDSAGWGGARGHHSPWSLQRGTRTLRKRRKGWSWGRRRRKVDPRIQGELMTFNQSTDDINRRETELEDICHKFCSVLIEATVKPDKLVKKTCKAVEDPKPYWEVRRAARLAQLEALRTTQDLLSRHGDYPRGRAVPAGGWQVAVRLGLAGDAESATQVMEAELTKTAQGACDQVQHGHGPHVAAGGQTREDSGRPVGQAVMVKGEYKMALRNLETISDTMHEQQHASATRASQPRRQGQRWQRDHREHVGAQARAGCHFCGLRGFSR